MFSLHLLSVGDFTALFLTSKSYGMILEKVLFVGLHR